MYFRCLQIKYTFLSVRCDFIRYELRFQTHVQEFEFAVPTPATIGKYLLQTCTCFETNSVSVPHSLVILVKHLHLFTNFFAHANSTDFCQVSWAKLGLSMYLDHTFGLDFCSAK